MKARSAEPSKGPIIVVQYRTSHGRAYELRMRESVLALHIAPPGSIPEPDRWHVEARVDTGRGPFVADGWGATAVEALRETALAWKSHVPSLAIFDWEAVTRELQLVRAV